MIILISFVGTLTRTTIGIGRVNFSSMGPMKGSICLLYGKSQVFIFVIFSIIISGRSASYLIEIVMFISFEYTLAQTIGVM